MMRVIETGRNPTMRYIGRTHGISVAWLHERFLGEDVSMAYEVSARMCADIYTKAFAGASEREHVMKLIAHLIPNKFWDGKQAGHVCLVPSKHKGNVEFD